MNNVTGIIFAVLMVLVPSINAQSHVVEVEKSNPEKRIALIIGNSAYEIGPLKNPVNDARDMAQALASLGFEVIYRENLNQNDMKRVIREFGARIRKGGVGLFYYAGHGVQVNGVNYLVPIGATAESEEEVEYECVDVGFVLAQMESARNGMNIMILDACRNNPFARSFRSVSRGLAQMAAPSGTMIAYATAPNSVASDGDGRNGVYTQEILKFIRTPNLSVEDVFKQVRISVRNITQDKQTPWESSSLIGNFFFKSTNTPPPQTVELSAPSDKVTPQNTIASNKQKINLQGISFELKSCKLLGTKITCQVLITNEASEDRVIYIYQSTQIVSETGEVFRPYTWQVGTDEGGGLAAWTTTTLVSNVPTNATFKFEGTSYNFNKLSLFRIPFSFSWTNGGRLPADFRDIILSK